MPADSNTTGRTVSPPVIECDICGGTGLLPVFDLTATKRDKFWRGPPPSVLAWAGLSREGEIMPAAIRETAEDVQRTCGSDCIPVRVTITFGPEENNDAK